MNKTDSLENQLEKQRFMVIDDGGICHSGHLIEPDQSRIKALTALIEGAKLEARVDELGKALAIINLHAMDSPAEIRQVLKGRLAQLKSQEHERAL